MTTPNGAIVFDATYGSDTQASGLGPATALYGSGATTDGTAVVTGISTTGVTAGDLLWVQTSSGRQFSIIASVDSSTQVTCDDTLSVGLGQTWAIGGKRASFNNSDSRRLLFAYSGSGDYKAGFVIETETDQTLTGSIGGNQGVSNGYWTIQGSAGSRKKITITTNQRIFYYAGNANGLKVKNLIFACSASSPTEHAFVTRGSTVFENCEFGDGTNNHASGCISDNFSDTLFRNCIFRTPKGIGNGNYSATAVVDKCVFESSTKGIDLYGASSAFIQNSIFKGCTDGIYVSSYPGLGLAISNCIFSGCTTGVNATSSMAVTCEDNAFHNCTTNITNMADSGTVSLTADPFTDSAAGDYSLNTDAGGGALLRDSQATVGSTSIRPFRWLYTAAASSGSSSSSGSKWTTLTDLTGLVAWYKPETLASTYSNGDSITTWSDSSGNSRDLTGSGTTRPLAAANAFGTYMAADFDGTDDVLSTASYQQAPNPCYSIVFEMDVLKNYNGPITIMNQNPPAWYTGVGNLSWVTTLIHSNGKIQVNRFKDTSNAYDVSLDGSASATTKYIMTIAYTEIAWDMRLNGSEVSGGASTNINFSFPSLDTAYIHLGHGGHSSSPFNGKIVEAVVYDAVDIDNANSIWVEGYLADKYGITLADGHLFKNAAPQNSPTTYNATSSGGSSYTNVAAAKFTRLE